MGLHSKVDDAPSRKLTITVLAVFSSRTSKKYSMGSSPQPDILCQRISHAVALILGILFFRLFFHIHMIGPGKLLGVLELPFRMALIITQEDSLAFPGQFRSHQTVFPLHFMKNPV